MLGKGPIQSSRCIILPAIFFDAVCLPYPWFPWTLIEFVAFVLNFWKVGKISRAIPWSTRSRQLRQKYCPGRMTSMRRTRGNFCLTWRTGRNVLLNPVLYLSSFRFLNRKCFDTLLTHLCATTAVNIFEITQIVGECPAWYLWLIWHDLTV